LFSCDHFVNWSDHLGNIRQASLADMLDSAKQETFGRSKKDLLPRYCRECQFLKYCWGACPSDRGARTPDGEPGLNHCCEGYRLFYAHTIPYFEAMAECLRHRRPAREFRVFMEQGNTRTTVRKGAKRLDMRVDQRPVSGGPKPKPNSPCPCGSGRKYKKCCGR
jgi:uncharacterized protein